MATVIQTDFQETPDGVLYEFNPVTLVNPGDVYVNAVKRGATLWHYNSTTLSVLFHAAYKVWLPSTTAGRLLCTAHGFTVATTVILWSATTLHSGLYESQEYIVTPVTVDILALTSLSGESILFLADGSGEQRLAVLAPPLVTDELTMLGVAAMLPVPSIIGDWDVATFRSCYAASTSLDQCGRALQSAVDAVEAYITEAAWTLFEARQAPYTTVHRVIAEVAAWYCNRWTGAGNVIEREQTHADSILKMRETYSGQGAMYGGAVDDILRQLSPWKKTVELEEDNDGYVQGAFGFSCGGTGRYIY